MSAAVLAVLAIIVGLHLMLTFSLIARVRTLQETLEGSRAQLPPVGTKLDPFYAATREGEQLSDALLPAASLVGFFMPGCAPCEKTRSALVEAPPDLPMLAFVSGEADDPAAIALAESLAKIARVAFATEGDTAYAAFRPPAFPSLYRIENGQLAAVGHTLRDVIR